MLLIFICFLYLIKSTPSTFRSMFELLTNDEIRNTTCENINSAVDDGPYFQVYDDKSRKAIFLLLNFDHMEMKIRSKTGIKISLIYNYGTMLWTSNSEDSVLTTKMINFVSSILKKKAGDGNFDIAIDVFASERCSMLDYKRNNEEISFINDLEKTLDVQKLGEIKNFDFVAKKTLLGDPKNKITLSRKKTLTVVLLPSVNEILEFIIFKDKNYRKLRNEYLDRNLKSRIWLRDQYKDDLIVYVVDKMGNNLMELEDFFNCILNSDIKFDYETKGFCYFVLKSLFTRKDFLKEIRYHSDLSFNLTNAILRYFKKNEIQGDFSSLIKFINGEIPIESNFNELEDSCQEVLKLFYRTLKQYFLVEIQNLITDKESKADLKNHFVDFIIKIQLLLEQKVDLYKNILHAFCVNSYVQENIQTWNLKGLRSISRQKKLDDCTYIKKHLPKFKSKNKTVYSRALYDLIKEIDIFSN
ncbi:hypothetical protein P3W45_000115 [Vairimorpha bombi]|jgi:hypothetical protein